MRKTEMYALMVEACDRRIVKLEELRAGMRWRDRFWLPGFMLRIQISVVENIRRDALLEKLQGTLEDAYMDTIADILKEVVG